MLIKPGLSLLAVLLVIMGLVILLNQGRELSPVIEKTIVSPSPVEVVPIEAAKNEIAVKAIPPTKSEITPDTTALEPCFSYWTQLHRVKFFDKKHFPNKEIVMENHPVGNLPKIICNLKVRNEFYSVMLATEPSTEKLVEITEGWLKPSGDELEVYRPDGSAFKKNQVLGFWGALELDKPTTSVKIKNCGAELGWGLQCPQTR